MTRIKNWRNSLKHSQCLKPQALRLTKAPPPLRRHLYMGGLIVGKDPNLLFDPCCPYAGCRICGAVFQSSVDRLTNFDFAAGMEMRRKWAQRHARMHTDKEHLSLAYSGMWATPEAAQKLATYGIVALSDMVLYEETAIALANARSVPIDDVEEGTCSMR